MYICTNQQPTLRPPGLHKLRNKVPVSKFRGTNAFCVKRPPPGQLVSEDVYEYIMQVAAILTILETK